MESERAGGRSSAGRLPFSLRRLALGSVLFGLFTVAGVWLVVELAPEAGPPPGRVLAAARAGPLLVLALLTAADFLLGGARLWALGRHLRPGFPLREGVRTHLYNGFASALTPLQAGAGPAQYWALTGAGVDGGRAVAILTANWVGNMAVYVALSGAALTYLLLAGPEFAIDAAFQGLLAAFGLLALVSLAAVLFPRPLERLLLRPGRRRAGRARRRLVRALGRYRRAVRGFFGEGRRAWAANVCLSGAKMVVRCAMGLAAIRALGVAGDALSALARVMLQYAVTYVSPTPGGSGVAEVSALGFMAGLVPPGLLAAYAVLWRTATSYVGVVAGIPVVALDLARRKRCAGRAREALARGAAGNPSAGVTP